MTFVITENCIQCKFNACVDVCPVDSFRETPLMLVIDPEECIDCTLCEPECPSGAIYSEDELPPGQRIFKDLNAILARAAPVITEGRHELPNARLWNGVPGKAALLGSIPRDAAVPPDPMAIAAYERLLTAQSLASEEWETALSSADPLPRLLVAMRADFAPDPARIEKGLADPSAYVRRQYALLGRDRLTPEQVTALLGDAELVVRLATIEGWGATLSAEQFALALQDPEPSVRIRAITLWSRSLTPKQFVECLDRRHPQESAAVLARISADLVASAVAHPSVDARVAAYSFQAFPFSPQQLDAGLHDVAWQVRSAVLRRAGFRLTPNQYLHLLSSFGSESAHLACAIADDAAFASSNASVSAQAVFGAPRLTPAQWTRCFADERREISRAALDRRDCKLDERDLETCLRSIHPDVRRKAISLFGAQRLSPEQIEACLTDPSQSVRAILVANDNVSLSAPQLERALTDRAVPVRVAAASRSDFAPSVWQFRRGAKDTSPRVAEIFQTRFAQSDGRIVARYAERMGARTTAPDALDELLEKMNAIPTWTKHKKALKESMVALVNELSCVHFTVSARDASLRVCGETAVIEVPLNKRGALQTLRGKTVQLICLGAGRYSKVHFAARAV